MPPLKRFPSNPVTPHGAYHVLHDRIPQMGLSSFDDTVVFNMMGGLAIPDFINSPGRVEVKDLKGLVPPWRDISQKGATQDGITFVDALYDAIEIELTTRVKGKNPADCRRVARYLMDSIDIKRTSRLWFFTHDMGYWWSDIRWFKTPSDPVGGIRNKTVDLTLRLRGDTGFWQTYPDVDEFTFAYNETEDLFDAADDLTGIGSGWTVAYSGTGSGILQRRRGQVEPTLTGGRYAVARRNGYVASTNNVVVDFRMGTIGQWWGFAPDGYADIWGRMNNTGTPGTHGIRLRLNRHNLWLSSFVNGVEKILRHKLILIPPLENDPWRLIVGDEENERRYSVMRGGATLFTVVEPTTGTPSLIGPSYRSAGFSEQSNTTALAPAIRSWSAGVNATVSQSKFLRRVNVGDQPMADNYICYGPGLFKFWNGPGADIDEYVEFGPLEENQIMYLRTDPRKRGVVDMTSVPPTPQQQTFWEKALDDFLSFATGSNSTPLAEEIKSWFGIKLPQGNPYSLLKGRWSNAALIPAKSPGKAADVYWVKCEIDDGNANSKVIVTGTPMRRMPY